ncbi:MAG: sulfite exporter TauE/SafE family protein [Candidatus Eremiobacteraeota bacterium]|nr:sulfite exporter TauE/SafE family protein [Candidatus Eremiobacteraeota bacterium]
MLFGVAIVSGAINSVAGGGSFLTFPTLIFTGVAPISANATNNFAMWIGTVASVRGYREEVREQSHLLRTAVAVSLVGSIIGALLLLHTPARLFERLIPYLLLFATLVFAFSPLFTKPHLGAARHHTPIQLLAQFLTAVYGGYFGAGIGFLMLAILAFSGLPNLNSMNAVKHVLAAAINGVALIPFIAAGIIQWPQALVMAFGAILGGYFGSRIGRRIPSSVVRTMVIAIGAAMTLYFFLPHSHRGGT